MPFLEPSLAIRLRDLRVDVDSPDEDTLILRNVPADERVFTKPRTNVLLKRPRQGLPFLIGVDEDLEYTGNDQSVIRAFTGAVHQQGWRVIQMGNPAQADLDKAVDAALGVLGLRKGKSRPKSVKPEAAGGLLVALGCNLSEQVRKGKAQATVGREEQIEQVAGCVIGWRGRLPLVVAGPGVGKTNLLHAVARKLSDRTPESAFFSLDLGVLMAGTALEAERENLLMAVLRDALSSGAVVALERLEFALFSSQRGAALLADALDRGFRGIGTTVPALKERMEVYPLSGRLELVELAEPDVGGCIAVVHQLRASIAEHYGVKIAEDLVEAVVERSIPLAGHLPAKALALLDAAAARATLGRAPVVQLADVYIAASRMRDA